MQKFMNNKMLFFSSSFYLDFTNSVFNGVVVYIVRLGVEID